MNPSDAFAIAMLAVVGLVMMSGLALVVFARGLVHRKSVQVKREPQVARVTAKAAPASLAKSRFRRPALWLAIRSRDTICIQRALGLRNPAPCSWTEGIVATRRLFIAPPVNGWTLVFGSGLPDPGDDVDVTFRFLRDLSRQLGQVQLFQADTLLQHHAWALAESGRIVRAYAWAGATVWNQGVKTAAEVALGVKCYGYGEPTDDDWIVAEFIVANVEKVPQLARRWSLDPAEIDLRAFGQARGIAGRHSRRY